MSVFADRLRKRIEALSLSHAEVARRTGLDTRRFGHYATGLREPDFQTLIRIAKALATTPDALLGVVEDKPAGDEDAKLRQQIVVACQSLRGRSLEIILAQVLAVVALERGEKGKKPGRRARTPRSARAN